MHKNPVQTHLESDFAQLRDLRDTLDSSSSLGIPLQDWSDSSTQSGI